MKIIQTAQARTHYFYLARYLHKQNALECIFSGYPMFKLKGEPLPKSKIKTFPWSMTLRMAVVTNRIPFSRALVPGRLMSFWRHWEEVLLDKYVSRNLKKCDVFIGQSHSGLITGKKAKEMGATYICDRPSSHIRHQSDINKEELSLWSIKPTLENSVNPTSILIEEQEYNLADFIVVPSEYSRKTFIEKGFSTDKIIKISLGADLSRFKKVSEPDLETFTALFVGQVSISKGFLYLLEDFNKLKIKKKRLIVIGALRNAKKIFELKKMDISQVEFIDRVDNSDLYKFYNKSNVFVFPSIDEGFGMVMGEAMACGCPVIATENTGAPDLFENGKEGFIVPIRNVNILAEKMQQLYEDKSLRAKMSEAAEQKIKDLGGWETSGKNYYEFLKANLKNK